MNTEYLGMEVKNGVPGDGVSTEYLCVGLSTEFLEWGDHGVPELV